MLDDQQLLRQYAADGSEAAFGALVSRYVNLVYSAALRQVNGDAHLAQDVAQLVFTDLARKARFLSGEVVLAGWLHRATRFAALQLLRTENRRRAREQEAVVMNAINLESAPDWEQIRPLLDETLDRLSREDREVLLLRFFEQQNFANIGAALGSNEDAARKRVSRALEKLRGLLVRRGATTSTAMLMSALSANAVQSAPAGLATALASTSLAAKGAATLSTFTILKLMAATKFKVGIVSAVIVASVTIPLVIQHQAQGKMRERDETLRQQAERVNQLQTENERLSGLASDTLRAKSQMRELNALRSEAESLRSVTNDVVALRQENRRLRAVVAPKPKTAMQVKEEVTQRMNTGKQWMIAFMVYAQAHDNQLPGNFDDALSFLEKENRLENGGKLDAATIAEQFDIVYQGSLKALGKPPETTIVMQEKEAWPTPETADRQGTWAKVYVFADGHVEIHQENTSDGFAAYEKEHTVATADNQ